MAASAKAPIGLYIHLPWCLAKCPYCDFNSHVLKSAGSLDRYVTALGCDIEIDAALARGRPVTSIFLGGGTPSVFSPEQIGAVLEHVRRHFAVAGDAEVTMEANPGSLGERQRGDAFAGYLAAGANRLSIGAQSFDSRSLEMLGRIHGPAEIEAAYTDARAAGFDNINLDLMFGLPEQSVDTAAWDVERAIALGPEHVSYYELTLEPNTVFHARPPAGLPDEAAASDIQNAGLERLARAGYRRYEVSAFARDSAQCRHNVNYWTFGDYLGVGAGAHAKWRDEEGRTSRSRKVAHPEAYLKAAEGRRMTAAVWRLDDADLAFEFALNALRLLDGFTEGEFTQRTGLGFEAVEEVLTVAERDGLVSRIGFENGAARWCPTPLGLRFLNYLQARFLPADGKGRAPEAASG